MVLFQIVVLSVWRSSLDNNTVMAVVVNGCYLLNVVLGKERANDSSLSTQIFTDNVPHIKLELTKSTHTT